MLDTFEHTDLTSREEDVYKLLLQGLNKKEIADYLCLQKTTICSYAASLYRKLKVCSIHKLMAKRIKELEHTIQVINSDNA